MPMPVVLKQLEKILELRPEEAEELIRDLRAHHQALWEEMVIGAYLEKEISLSKAAELLDLHAIELRRRFQARGIPIFLGPENSEEAKAEGEALEGLAR